MSLEDYFRCVHRALQEKKQGWEISTAFIYETLEWGAPPKNKAGIGARFLRKAVEDRIHGQLDDASAVEQFRLRDGAPTDTAPAEVGPSEAASSSDARPSIPFASAAPFRI